MILGFPSTSITDSTAAGRTLLTSADAAAQKATLSVDDLVTLSGVADGATSLGTFTGSTIADSSTIKAALQSLETSLETKQASDAELTALAGLTSAADKVPYFTGSGTAAVADYTASARTFTALAAALGDTVYGSATNVWSKLAGNITLMPTVESQTGNGSVSGVPARKGRAIKRVSSSVAKTNNTLATLSDLSVTVAASGIYIFEFAGWFDSDAAAGAQFSINGSATATAIRYQGLMYGGGGGVIAATTATALNTACGFTAVTAGFVRIWGSIVVNSGGTLAPYFAQNVTNAVASNCLVGSWFDIQEAT